MKNKGITLIALVVTVILMIIIAGVAITMTIGENSVISKSEIATYQNSITQIEQCLNEYYVQHYSEIGDENSNNKARTLAYFLKTKLGTENIFKDIDPSETYHVFEDDEYVYTSDEGKTFYILEPENLKSFDSNIKVLDLEPNLSEKGTLKLLYGVSCDLRVFVIIDGLDNMIGITKDELTYIDPNTIIYKGGSDWAKILGSEGDVTYQSGQAKKKVTIDFNSKDLEQDFDLSGIGELSHLESLVLKNSKQDSIKGIADSKSTLTYLWIENPNIKDYTGLEELIKLKYLYLYNVSQEQLDKIIDQISNGNYPNLQYLGVIGTGGWSDYSQGFTDERYCTTRDKDVDNIECFKKLNTTTKKAVKYLFLTANNIKSLEPLSDFSNLVSIRADANLITSLNGLSNKPNLTTIRINFNSLTSLSGLSGVPKLNWLDVRYNKSITSISNVKNITSLKKLWFISDTSLNRGDSDDKISENEIIDNKDFLVSLGTGLQIDPKYSKYLVEDNTTTRLELKGKIESAVFANYENCKNLNKLSINGIVIIDENGKTLSDSDSNTLINQVLSNSNLSTIEYLQIINMDSKLTTLTFLSNMKNLREFDLRNCDATDLKLLVNTPIKKLSINNSKIDLTSDEMQKVISNLTSSGYWTKGSGLLLCNDSLYDQLSKCKNITKLYMDRYWEGQIAATATGKTIDLSKCSNLTAFYSYNIQAKYILPSNISTCIYAQGGSSASLDLSKCNKITSLNISDNVDSSVLRRIIESIPANNSLEKVRIYAQAGGVSSYSYISCLKNSTKLKSLEITSWSSTRVSNLSNLEGINQLSTLESLTISYAPKLTSLSDMSKLVNLKTLSITNCALEEILDVGLNNLPNLQTINFTNNNITNLYGLVVKNDSDFKNLNALYLENNALEDNFFMGVIMYPIQEKIFVPLYNKKLRILKLAGNKISDFSQISSLKWTEKSGF